MTMLNPREASNNMNRDNTEARQDGLVMSIARSPERDHQLESDRVRGGGDSLGAESEETYAIVD